MRWCWMGGLALVATGCGAGSLPYPGRDAGVVDVPSVSDVGTVDAGIVDAPPVDGGTCPPDMALIPAGSFSMGDTDTLSFGAQPPHMVTLSAFCMDLTEVTVAAYRTCSATGCTDPSVGHWLTWGATDRENHPINGVAWNQSRAYSQALGRDLPTEAQWEYAARGTDGRIYPWGNAPPVSQLCWNSTSPGGTCPVRAHPEDISPFGVFNMAGNVAEWTSDWYGDYTSSDASDPTGPASGPSRVMRGGNWGATTGDLVRAAGRRYLTLALQMAGKNSDSNLGFRCAGVPH